MHSVGGICKKLRSIGETPLHSWAAGHGPAANRPENRADLAGRRYNRPEMGTAYVPVDLDNALLLKGAIGVLTARLQELEGQSEPIVRTPLEPEPEIAGAPQETDQPQAEASAQTIREWADRVTPNARWITFAIGQARLGNGTPTAEWLASTHKPSLSKHEVGAAIKSSQSAAVRLGLHLFDVERDGHGKASYIMPMDTAALVERELRGRVDAEPPLPVRRGPMKPIRKETREASLVGLKAT